MTSYVKAKMSHFEAARARQQAQKVCAVEGHIARTEPYPDGSATCRRCGMYLVRPQR